VLTKPIPDLPKEVELLLWSEVVEINGRSSHAAIVSPRQVCRKAGLTLSSAAKLRRLRRLRPLQLIVGPPARSPDVRLHAKCRTAPPTHRYTQNMRAAMLKKTIQDRWRPLEPTSATRPQIAKVAPMTAP
jgi:hypothetical protein